MRLFFIAHEGVKTLATIYSNSGTSLNIDNPDLLKSYLSNGNWSTTAPGESSSTPTNTPSTPSSSQTNVAYPTTPTPNQGYLPPGYGGGWKPTPTPSTNITPTPTSTPSQPTSTNPFYDVNDPAFMNKTVEERIRILAANPDLARQEILRDQSVYNKDEKTGDMTDANAAHAWADQVRNAAGISETDPTYGGGTAYGNGPFTSVVPGYVTPTGEQVQSDGSLQLEANGQKEPDVPVYQGTSFASAQDLAKDLGVDYSRDPKTGEITIGGKKFQPIGFQNGSAMVNVRDVAEALGKTVGYDDNSKKITITDNNMNKLPTTPQPAPTGTPQQQYTGASPYVGQLVNNMPQPTPITPYTPPDLSAWQNQIMNYQQFNPDWNNYYQQSHNQIDPLYQTQYQQLMNKQAQDLQSSDTSMNRRGIFTSGIAEAAANDLRAKTTDAVASVFNKQMSQVAQTAQKLYDDAFSQYQKGNQFALDNNKNVMGNMLAQEKQAFTEWLQSQKLDQTQYNYAMNAWDKMATLIQHDVQFNQTMDWNQFKFSNLSADQQANLQKGYDQMAQEWQKTLLPYNQMTQYQQGQLNQGQQKIDLQSAAQQASNYFKQLGINIDSAKLEELIRHDQAGESLQSQKLTADMVKSQAQLKEKMNYDQAMVDKASASALDTAKRTQLEGYKAELSTITQQISNYVNTGHPEKTPPELMKAYNDTMDKVTAIITPQTSETNPTFE